MVQQASETDETFSKAYVRAVQQRAAQLARLATLEDRFVRTGKISREIVLQIAEQLVELGRLWEAEAWSAIATTLPEDEAVDVNGFRSKIAKQLNRETAWQILDGHVEFEIDRVAFDLPEIEKVVSSQKNASERSLPDQLATSRESHVSIPGWKMTDQAKQRGLQFFGRTGDKLDQPGVMLYQTLGCGGGTIDFDRDGWADLYLIAAGGTPPERDSQPNQLFRNLEGNFSPIGNASSVDDTGFGQGVAIGDLNEDGFADLLVLNYGPNRLYINQGDGTFRDASNQLPTEPHDEWSSSGAIADVDGDGLSDFFIANYCSGLGPVTQTCHAKGTCSPMAFPAAKDRIVKSTPDGELTDVSQDWLGDQPSKGRGLGIIIGDLDRSQGNELLVANDMTNNHFYKSEREATSLRFTESAMLRGLSGDDRGIAQGSMGIATGDFDRDYDIDFYVTNFAGEYNTLHLQTGPGIWQDRTAVHGLIRETLSMVGFGSEAVDVANDGSVSIFTVNGHVDIFSRGNEPVMYAQPVQVCRLDKDWASHWIDVKSLGDYFAKPHVGRSLWTIDANRDGKMDLVTTHQTEPVALLVNETVNAKSQTDHSWVRLELVGTTSSRDAVGASVSVKSGEQTLCGFRTSGSGYQCSNDPMLHFGLGQIAKDTKASVTVIWPGGGEETFPDVALDMTQVLVEGSGRQLSKTVD